jgi:hypothetical protein
MTISFLILFNSSFIFHIPSDAMQSQYRKLGITTHEETTQTDRDKSSTMYYLFVLHANKA